MTADQFRRHQARLSRLPFSRFCQMADIRGIKPEERGRQVCADLDRHRNNGSVDFSLGDGHQVVMLGEHLGSPRRIAQGW